MVVTWWVVAFMRNDGYVERHILYNIQLPLMKSRELILVVGNSQ